MDELLQRGGAADERKKENAWGVAGTSVDCSHVWMYEMGLSKGHVSVACIRPNRSNNFL